MSFLGVLKIKTLTWDKVNYELFDTESNQHKSSIFSLQQEGFIYRNNSDNQAYYQAGPDTLKGDKATYKILIVI
jgi:hypothetical protein